jgi:hypothetical protein
MSQTRPLSRWRRAARYFDKMAFACWRAVDSVVDHISVRLPNEKAERESWRPIPVNLQLTPYEPRFMPGSSIGLGLGAIGTGLELLNRESLLGQPSIAQPPARHAIAPADRVQQSLPHSLPQPLLQGFNVSANSGQSSQPVPRPNRDVIDDITDPFGDLWLDENGDLQGAQSQRGGGRLGEQQPLELWPVCDVPHGRRRRPGA